MRQDIVLAAGSRPIGGLLAATRPLESARTASGTAIGQRWGGGVVFSGRTCAPPAFGTPCAQDTGEPDDEDVDVGSPPSGLWSFMPADIRQGTQCTTLSRSDAARMSRERLDETREWSVAHVLQTGQHTEHTTAADSANPDITRNPALIDATLITAVPLPALDALACLEQHAANNLFGAPAFIHASPLVGTHLLGAPGIHRDGRTWRTAMGSIVVISPGYTGPDLYVTTEVWAATGPVEEVEGIDRRNNTLTAWAAEAGIAVFDACWFGRVTVDVELCEEGT
jgi:hypothetical protein